MILNEDQAPPAGERTRFAFKHRGMLEGASRWFESLGFPPPHMLATDGSLQANPDTPYVGFLSADGSSVSSSHDPNGYMTLTTHPGFLDADTPKWTLLEASAVHELYHGIQKGINPLLNAWIGAEPPRRTDCPGDLDVDWLVEGTAAMVQIRWLEGQAGVPYGHPFKGSNRAAWVRFFDQSLHRGSLPPDRRGSADTQMSSAENVSWLCDYGTWYFWYAIGDMIGRTDAEKVTYTRFLFDQGAGWADAGIENVDAGLKAAAAAYDAIEPYREGLYDLYPEFVAQYLTDDQFYENLEEVDLEAPGYFETTSSLSGGPLEPLASRAWRVRVRLPENGNASSIPYAVRFSLDAPDEDDRDDLHLIVDEDVAGRPVDDTAPYVAVERTDEAAAIDGTVEYLIRVANVATEAEETEDRAFSLRVEVEGFYGEDVTGPSASDIADELPPGFSVRGPEAWTCDGGPNVRAIFDLATPDELGRDLDRALPEMARDMSDMMDNMEIMIQRMERQGQAAGMSSEEIAEMRQRLEAEMEAARVEVQPDVDRGADEMRARRVTQLLATFVGRNGGGECQMTLGATLVGREGGAQMIPGAVDPDPNGEAPEFEVSVFPEAFLDRMRAGMAAASQSRLGSIPSDLGEVDDAHGGWTVCTMTARDREQARSSETQRQRYYAESPPCEPVLCTEGRLVLERAEQGRIAGSFEFEVVKWADEVIDGCQVAEGRDTVAGHFNVASTDDGYDDNSIGGFGLGTGLAPGMPILDLRAPD